MTRAELETAASSLTLPAGWSAATSQTSDALVLVVTSASGASLSWTFASTDDPAQSQVQAQADALVAHLRAMGAT